MLYNAIVKKLPCEVKYKINSIYIDICKTQEKWKEKKTWQNTWQKKKEEKKV